jgi:hypothetical protein
MACLYTVYLLYPQSKCQDFCHPQIPSLQDHSLYQTAASLDVQSARPGSDKTFDGIIFKDEME